MVPGVDFWPPGPRVKVGRTPSPLQVLGFLLVTERPCSHGEQLGRSLTVLRTRGQTRVGIQQGCEGSWKGVPMPGGVGGLVGQDSVVPPPSASQLRNFSIPSHSARLMISPVVRTFLLSMWKNSAVPGGFVSSFSPSARGEAPSHSHLHSSTKPARGPSLWQEARDRDWDRPVRAQWPGWPSRLALLSPLYPHAHTHPTPFHSGSLSGSPHFCPLPPILLLLSPHYLFITPFLSVLPPAPSSVLIPISCLPPTTHTPCLSANGQGKDPPA